MSQVNETNPTHHEYADISTEDAVGEMSYTGWISDEFISLFMQVMVVFLAAVIGFLGIVFNLASMLVFVRIGFSDAANISLLSLSLTHVAMSVAILWSSLMNSTVISSYFGQELLIALNYSIQGTVHIFLSRIAGSLTALIAMERFICVAWPLRVKYILTPKVTAAVIVGVCFIMVSLIVPLILGNPIGPFLDHRVNTTVYGIILSPYSNLLEDITFIAETVVQVTSFFIVTVSTIFLIRSLRRAVEWRSLISQSNIGSTREKQLVKIVILISTVFIVCTLPTAVCQLIMVFVKDFNLKGRLKNLFVLVGAIVFLLDSVHSLVNIFVYVKVSSRFRETLFSMLKRMSSFAITE